MPTPPSTTTPPRHHFADLPRVLSIQSHVVSGRVGNRAAVFPLQLHRFDVDEINTVSFSNHTGYGAVEGTRLSGEGLEDLLSGLERNGLLVKGGGKSATEKSRPGYSYVLTGYVGRAETLKGIREAIRGMIEGGRGGDDDDGESSDDGGDDEAEEAEKGAANGEEKERRRSRKRNQRPLVVVDPVMGDHDRGRARTSNANDGNENDDEEGTTLSTFLSSLYVPDDVPSVYRSLLSLADVVTPNAFEAEMLLMEEEEGGRAGGRGGGNVGTTSKIVDEASAVAACSRLHERGPGIVVLTSVAFPASSSAPKEDTLTIYASQCARVPNSDGDGPSPSSSSFPRPPEGATPENPAVWKLELPRVDAPFTGTGDLLTSLLLAFLHKAAAGRDDEVDGNDDEGEERETDDKQPRDVGWALERAAAGVRAVVEATVAGAAAEAARAEAERRRRQRRRGKNKEEEDGKEPPPFLSSDYWSSPRAVAARELRLVQCADALVSPQVVAKAERIR